MKEDQRPEPKPRQYPQLWQAYQWWDEIMQMRKKHTLRISSIEAGKSQMDLQFELDMIDAMQLDAMVKNTSKLMASFGKEVPVWKWFTSIKGIGDHTAAKVLALIDDISTFETTSQLWRYSGYAVIDGGAERNKKGEKSHFNRRLKSEMYLIGDQFIRHQVPGYVDIYYSEKSRIRTLHPEPEKTTSSAWPTNYTDSHVHRMAMRKMVKIFLNHLWVEWRTAEGYEITEPYAIAHLKNHTRYIEALEVSNG